MEFNRKINVTNKCSRDGEVIIYNRQPPCNLNGCNVGDKTAAPWLNRYVTSNGCLEIDFVEVLGSYVSHTGVASETHSASYKSCSHMPMSLTRGNVVTLKKEGELYKFTDLEEDLCLEKNQLKIIQHPSVVSGEANFGITRSGKPINLIKTEPRLESTFTIHDKMWVVFASHSSSDESSMTEDSDSSIFEFEMQGVSVDLVYNPDNTWSLG
ncbi:MAG: hypothetical protein ABW087_20930 [Candidatus Thiodiazotropha sp.]